MSILEKVSKLQVLDFIRNLDGVLDLPSFYKNNLKFKDLLWHHIRWEISQCMEDRQAKYMLKIISCQVGSSLKRPQLLLVQDAVKDTCSFSACGVPFPSLTLFSQTRAA